MKRLIGILTLLFLFKPVFPLVDYAFRYDYIRTELCVNRDEPVLQCNGKCHLMKELAKASENEKPASPDKKHGAYEVYDLFFFTADSVEFIPVSPYPVSRFHYAVPAPQAFSPTILRPPIV